MRNLGVISMVTLFLTLAAPVQSEDKKITLVRFEYNPGEIGTLCDNAIRTLKAGLDKVAAHDHKKRTFKNTVEELEHLYAEFGEAVYTMTYMRYISPIPHIRKEATACSEKATKFSVEMSLRKDIYNGFKAWKESLNNDFSSLEPSKSRLAEVYDKSFKKSGVVLEGQKYIELKKLKKRMVTLKSQFGQNLNEDKTSFTVTKKELAGTPERFQKRLKKTTDGLYILTTKYPDLNPILKYADSGDVRKRMYVAYTTRATSKKTDNSKLLQEAIGIRHRLAQLLDFKTWADYRISTENRMAKSAKEVRDFLDDLRKKLAVRHTAEMKVLLDLKKADIPGATTLELWDKNYYAEKLIQQKYQLDQNKVREYFPSRRVIQGTFDIYSKLLGLEFKEAKHARAWDKLATVYEVRDAQSKKLISYFYADLYPREGKYGHAHAAPIIPGRILRDRNYRKPISVMLANVSPPSKDGTPSLMTHDEVETFFHEFGHIMHQTLTKAAYASYSGSEVAHDFSEAPSQMFENWIWDADMLKILSGHFKDEKQKLPADLREKLLKLKKFNKGMHYTRQAGYGLLDMTLHMSGEKVDPVQVDHMIRRTVEGFVYPKECQWIAGFGHMMGGYDSGYYGYLWSEVYSDDMFTKFKKEGLLNVKTGMALRKKVLEKGSSKNEMELVTDFLGRKPNKDAFLKKLGIEAAKKKAPLSGSSDR